MRLGLALLAVLLLPQPASACSCLDESVEVAIGRAGAIFEGRVTAMTAEDGRLEVTLAVTQAWRGIEHETVVVQTTASEVSCGYPFEVGHSYLVYTEPGETLSVSLCSRTRSAAGADEDRAELGSGTIPVDIEDEVIEPIAPARTPPARGGCASCAAGRSAPAGPIALALLLVALVIRRR